MSRVTYERGLSHINESWHVQVMNLRGKMTSAQAHLSDLHRQEHLLSSRLHSGQPLDEPLTPPVEAPATGAAMSAEGGEEGGGAGGDDEGNFGNGENLGLVWYVGVGGVGGW